MRLIDADELLNILQKQQKLGSVNDSRGRAKAILEVIHAPTIDAEPVKHGTGLPHKITASVKCSNCSRVFPDATPRCPNCGAKMDGDGT